MLINQACRFLDKQTEHQKTWGSYFNQIVAGGFHLSIPHCRAIKEVWVSTTTERWQLEKKDLQDVVVDYLSSQPTNGESMVYSPVITRKIPEDADLSAFSAYMTYLDTMTTLTNDYNGIVVLPPTDSTILVEVRGFFYSAELVEETDVNYWTVNHPLTLVKAVMRELEIFNQNQSKVKGWDEALGAEITNIAKDLVSEIIAEVDQIEAGDEGEIG
jgi:hypothetical protein